MNDDSANMPVSHWNHRVVRFRKGEEDEYLQICEVFYDNDVPSAHSTDGPPVMGDTVDDLRETLERMQRCLKYPILDEMASEEEAPPTSPSPPESHS